MLATVLYSGVAILNPGFAKQHRSQIIHLHTWDYGFWLEYLDLQALALGLEPIYSDLDGRASDALLNVSHKALKLLPGDQLAAEYRKLQKKSYVPIIQAITNFWQQRPATIYGSEAYLQGMAETFFRAKISFEEPEQGRQIKRTLKSLKAQNWDQLQTDLLDYPGWWN